ncbi:MAG: N-acetylmuramoyl-L-alanine amidase [Solirubrobacterales bacterium]|nr:N-acetylmuramoyl-L-alanine amidase [Solirubrobacterales bacterium]
MGNFWLNNALTPLAAALGNKLILIPDYDIRSRSTGGFEKIAGIVMHHDADPPTGADIDAVRYCYLNALAKPIGNFHVTRAGLVYWGAAGASNHAGKGGEVTTSKGIVPLDQGNKYLIGIEASNNGVGEPWPQVQIESYLALVVTLCKTYELKPATDVYAHWTWVEPSCPGRKIDPLGPTPTYPKFGGLNGLNKWNMQEVRKELIARMTTILPPPPLPEYQILGKTYPTTPGDPILKLGVKHSNVRWLQAILCSMDTLDGRPIYNPAWVETDTFSEATYNAVVYWQSVNDLNPDGIYGTVTADRMLLVRGK